MKKVWNVVVEYKADDSPVEAWRTEIKGATTRNIAITLASAMFWSVTRIKNANEVELVNIIADEVERPARVSTLNELEEWARSLGVRSDWHEPDEQGLTAEVRGRLFDNAGFWFTDGVAGKDFEELHVVVSQDGVEKFAVNLATLFSWATRDAV